MNRFLLSLAKTALVCAVLLLASTAAALAGTLRGQVLDAETGAPLPGANVLLTGTPYGTATGANGRFVLTDLPEGDYTMVVRYLGYEDRTQTVRIGEGAVVVDVALRPTVYSGSEIAIVSDRATERETPVAFTNVDKVQLQRQLGSRDLPLVLSTTPSVYATAQGGGAGDARINVRGFNQRNVAIMINGVPVNDMENGWVYWSNWDGVGDATSTIQLQRGLSAVNLATPSIGGTLNIITDPAAMSAGAQLKQEFGSGGFFKTTVTASTGLLKDRYALMVSGVRKTGDGVIDGTWTDAWAYYVAGSYQVNRTNRLDLFALGAPQRHGQNLYRQNIAVYDRAFAEDLDDYDPAAFAKYNEAGRTYNQNWAPLSSDYDGRQAVEDGTFDRFDRRALSERENFYHKPQVNLNWYAQLSERLLLTTVAYYSGGEGGGSGTAGSLVRRPFVAGERWFASAPWSWNWDATVARNDTSSTGSLGILRNSRNNQWTVGAISKLQIDLTEALQLQVGLDVRTAEIEHYREVRDLLGGDYFLSKSSDFWPEEGKRLGLGDRFAYDFTNTVDWAGSFVQGEYVKRRFSLYGMAGLSAIKYGYTNHFRRDPTTGGELTSETDPIRGYQVKGGGLYRLSELADLYANLGFVSKVPIFDGVIDDVGGIVNPDPKNERFVSFEAGTNLRSPGRTVSGRFNVYRTTWQNRTITRGIILADGTEGLVNLAGMDALHQGVEGELAWQPLALVRLDVAASVGDWRYTDDVSGTYRPDDRSGEVTFYDFYVNDLKVGDAPQTQVAYAVSLYPVRGLFVQGVGKTFARHFADFDPLGRTDPADRAQSWQVPSYTVVDLHVGYELPIRAGLGVELLANVFNLLDATYIQDALDNSQYNAWDNDHDADDAEVFFGLPRTFNVGVRVRY